MFRDTAKENSTTKGMSWTRNIPSFSCSINEATLFSELIFCFLSILCASNIAVDEVPDKKPSSPPSDQVALSPTPLACYNGVHPATMESMLVQNRTRSPAAVE